MNRRPFVYAGSLAAGLLLTFVVAFLAWWHAGFSCQAASWIVHNALPLSEQDRARWLRHRSHSWPERPPGICTESRGLSVHWRHIAVSVSGGGFVRFDETSEQRRERRRGTGTFSVARIVYGFPWPCFELETWQESGSIDVNLPLLIDAHSLCRHHIVQRNVRLQFGRNSRVNPVPTPAAPPHMLVTMHMPKSIFR